MCVEIEINGMVADDLASLAKSVDQIVYDDAYDPQRLTLDACLCCVDLLATASANGLQIIKTQDPFYLKFAFGEDK
ncbi:hypothetical protein SAMN04488030_2105 [Aliiroseovarius halocynthiae]|uniref:Uncharacterized protein n=1 Tax=Aliiroseovarius halocynthiae TaxID=985055 RepID=A0A545SRM6_9RHOB|nr:hypothetical protein [Aliiroseovarius halocynthiae]TQV67612.1 hypothetical protein FIL88_10380 [Aliiroseovarius halocynthiae]SMR81635.1 hypothetical protein SAMN04488030_2105 [Aliiroseovarius halocynthiae]